VAVGDDGYRHIAERPVDPVGQPANAGSTYINNSNQYDVAVAGLPFFLGPSKEYPYKRETAQYRKQQIDQQKEPGEQTLTGWWLRSQSSFHYGAGIRYEEPVEGQTVGNRFNRSAGVDVFNIGKVTLLPDVAKNTEVVVSGTPILVGGTDANGVDVVLTASGSNLYRTTAAGVNTTLTWGGSGTILALANDGVNYYAANATGIYKGPLTGASSGTSIFTHPASVGTVTKVTMSWVKQRIIAGINNYLFEVTPIISYTVNAAGLSANVATITTSTAHNFGIGSQITVSGITAAATATITGASVVSGVVTYTAINSFAVGQQVTITGVSPVAYNITGRIATATTANFTIVDTSVSGIYSSGGTASFNPYNGTYSVTANTPTTASYYRNSIDVALVTGLSGTAVLASNNNVPIYAHPNPNWVWTGICEGPNAIYASGYVGDSSTVYRLSLDTNGAVPLLTKAVTAADMPKGEIIYALGAYIGKYMVFGTNKGIRVGQIDTSGFVSSGYITYGPLTVVTNGFNPSDGHIISGYPCKSITFNDRYAYCTVTSYIDSDGSGTTLRSGLIKIDLSREIAANQMAYASHLQVPTGAEASAVCIIGSTNKLAIGVAATGLYFQANTLISSGYIQTGQIRYFTLEDKHFELVKLRQTLPMQGTLTLTVVNSDESAVDIITVDNAFDFTQDITGMDTQDVYPKESLGLRFTLTAGTGQLVGNEDSFNGYQLKALPAVRRQRMITLPLLCYDFEGDRYNMTTGFEGRAAERISALENIESGGDVVNLQDFTNNETVRGVIESLTFVRMTPPERRFKGFGGMLICQFRTV
jgi:hypothetical protein